jgi:hypothetical protein
MNKRTKATAISMTVRKNVYARDQFCIFCGRSDRLEAMHFIPRSKGGLGIEENLAMGCLWCHGLLDQSVNRPAMLVEFRRHLDSFYPEFTDDMRVYRKGEKE